MPIFKKRISQIPVEEIIITLIVLSIFILASTIGKDPQGYPFIFKILLTALPFVGWINFLFRWCVYEIELDDKRVTIRWKNRVGRKMVASDEISNLYYKIDKDVQGPHMIFVLMRRRCSKSFTSGVFMMIVGSVDGGEDARFPELAAFFDAAGVQNKS